MKKSKWFTFNTAESLKSVQACLRAQNDRFWVAAEGSGAPDWEHPLEEFVEEICTSYNSAFVFGGRNDVERKTFLTGFRKLDTQEQRLIYLWCLNRASGVWKVGRHCNLQEATKAHLELCALGLLSRPKTFQFRQDPGSCGTSSILCGGEDWLSQEVLT